MTTPRAPQRCPSCEASFGWSDPIGPRPDYAGNAYWACTRHVESVHPETLFKCPRSDEMGAYQSPAYWGHDHTCSYCGSLHPDKFLEAVELGHEVGPTDKSYKAYIGHPHPHSKFYFQHLNEAQRAKFIELYNKDVMKIGYPGWFYTTPFFIKFQK